jgi:septin family protein
VTLNTSVQVARLDERMEKAVEIISRLELAVFGNGKPGLRQQVEAQESRLVRIEEQHSIDQEAAAAVESEKAEEEKAERSEWRKYKWGMIFFGTTVVIDILMQLLHVGGK